MSDQPLFQKADDQEKAFAPQQLTPDNPSKHAANADDNRRDAQAGADDVGVPAAGAGLLGQAGGGISSGIVGGAPSALEPVVGEAAPADDTAGDRRV